MGAHHKLWSKEGPQPFPVSVSPATETCEGLGLALLELEVGEQEGEGGFHWGDGFILGDGALPSASSLHTVRVIYVQKR